MDGSQLRHCRLDQQASWPQTRAHVICLNLSFRIVTQFSHLYFNSHDLMNNGWSPVTVYVLC